MRFATTLILLALVLGSAGYILFYESKAPTTDELRENAGKITRFDPAEIQTIAVRGSAGRVALRRKSDTSWEIYEPYEDRADPAWVKELLEVASDLEAVETIAGSEVGESIGLDEAGLGDGKFELEFTPSSGEPIRLEVGGPTPLKGTTYLRSAGGGDDIFVVGGDLHPLLAAQPSDLRDRRLIRLDASKLAGMSLRNARGELELQRSSEDEFWMLTRPLQTRGHRDAVDDLLATLTNIEIAGLAPNGSGDARAFEPGSTTVITLTPEEGSAEPVTVEFSQGSVTESDKLLARVSDRGPVFKVDAALKPDPETAPPVDPAVEALVGIATPEPPKLLDLLNRSPNDLRDDHLANLDAEAVSVISITDLKGYSSVLRRRGNLWLIEIPRVGNPAALEVANYKAVSDFFKALNSEKVIDFIDSSAQLSQFGLDRPYLRIGLGGFKEAGATPDASDGGSPETPEREIVDLRIGVNREDGKIYANFAGEPFVYRIDDALLTAAPADPLKWQSLSLLQFSYTHIKNLGIARGSEPPLSIECDFNFQRFRAISGGKDVTPLLEKRRLTNLALTLSGLRAANWAAADTTEIPLLESPSLTIDITIEAPQQEGAAQTITRRISLAPTVKGKRTAFFYGTLSSRPEVFVVPYATYRSLAASLIVDPKRPVQPGAFDDGLILIDPDTTEPERPAPPAAPDEEPAPSTTPAPAVPPPAVPAPPVPATPSAPVGEGDPSEPSDPPTDPDPEN